MKFVLALIAAVVVLAAVCHEGDAALTIGVPPKRGVVYDGDCNCENCKCVSRQVCKSENIAPGYCPGSFIFVCCRVKPAL